MGSSVWPRPVRPPSRRCALPELSGLPRAWSGNVDVQTDLHVVAARAVCHKACQVAQRFPSLRPGGQSAYRRLSPSTFRMVASPCLTGVMVRPCAPFCADLLQILHRFAGLRVLLQVDGSQQALRGLCLLRLRGGPRPWGRPRLGRFRRRPLAKAFLPWAPGASGTSSSST